MKKKIVRIALLGIALAAISIVPVAANAAAKGNQQQNRTQNMHNRGTAEIDARINNLNKLVSRIQEFKNVSDAQKASIVATIQSLITNLTNLKAQIESDTSTTTLKSDVQSVTQDYRVYALAMPQLNIIAAADRITTIVGMFNQVNAKLQSRITASTGMSNLSTLQADLSDLNAKVSDAATLAQAAVAEVSSLVPDQGDKTKMAANTTALKDARSKIQAAQKDLVAARKDAETIIKALVKADKQIINNSASSTNP